MGFELVEYNNIEALEKEFKKDPNVKLNFNLILKIYLLYIRLLIFI